jgi:hypothetical protein
MWDTLDTRPKHDIEHYKMKQECNLKNKNQVLKTRLKVITWYLQEC